jgi:hypothetical protein
VVEALDAAMKDVEADPGRRVELAALIAAWLEDEAATDDFPPIPSAVVARVRAHLVLHRH